MPILSADAWDQYLRNHPDAHLLQRSTWGALKSKFGWEVVSLANQDCGAQLLFRRLPLGMTIAYLPKGPVGENWLSLLSEMDDLCRQRGAIFALVEPDLTEPIGDHIYPQLQAIGRQTAPIQPRRTLVIDLQPDEKMILDSFKQKTRYNIHLAERKGITVHESRDIAGFYEMMVTTGKRDGFGVHSQKYFQRVFDLFSQRQLCVLLEACYQSQPLAALMVFRSGKRAWYFYGASTNHERNRMPTYLLQWEAMRWAKLNGCTEYDLWGVPDFEEHELEASFQQRTDGLWGVYRFKRGFGGKLIRSVGARVRVYRPLLYEVYRIYRSRRGEVD